LSVESVKEEESFDVQSIMSGVQAPAKKPRATGGASKAKKAIQVVAVVTPEGIEGSFTPEPRKPLIVHLPFRSCDVNFSDAGELRYDPNPPRQPEPWEGEDGDMYFKINNFKLNDEGEKSIQENEGWQMNISESDASSSSGSALTNTAPRGPTTDSSTAPAPAPAPAATTVQAPPENYNRVQILAAYATERGKTFTVPASTTVRCYWCAHGFGSAPCFLPVKEECGVFTVYGNFCSPQCGLAYLLKEHLDSHVRWERMALLHRIYKPIDGKRIYPAPARESLQDFGGPMTIEEYRGMIGANKVRVDIHTPPLVSLLGTMDTKPIDFYDSSLQNTFSTGGSMDRFKAWSEQGGALRLKRAKPLKDRESTLDAVIQISVKRGGE
jgi:hypothetical protein